MAVEVGKVLTAIETKFKGKSITKQFKTNLATKWAAKIDNDTDIDGYVDDREDVVLEAVREADQRVTDALKKATPPKDDKKPEEEKEIVIDADAPAWAKALAEQNKTLSEQLKGFQTQQTQQTLTQRFKGDERLKGVPDFILNRSIPKSEEEFESTITDLVTEYSTFAQANKIENLGADIPPGAGGGNTKQNDGKVDADLVKFATTLNETAKSEK